MSDSKKQKKKSKRPTSHGLTEPSQQTEKKGVGEDKDGKEKEKGEAERQKKAQLEIKIRERVASEARAFDVVSRLIEPGITAEYLLEACKFIDHTHYEDVVEERSISHLCGYPACNKTMKQVSKQKYHISTKSNTVYDITERKMYCSTRCYHASKHLHKQIPQTPVWTRRDGDCTIFTLLHDDVKVTAEGNEVIGVNMFDLRSDVQLLEKADRKTPDTSTTSQTKQSQSPAPVSFKNSQHLSEQLLSLSKEEDLEDQMGNLSLGEVETSSHKDTVSQREFEHPSSNVEEVGTLNNLEQGGQEESLCQSSQESGKETVEANVPKETGSCSRLEFALGGLTLEDTEVKCAADSDDDDSDDDVQQANVAVSEATSSTSSEKQDPGFQESSADSPLKVRQAQSKVSQTGSTEKDAIQASLSHQPGKSTSIAKDTSQTSLTLRPGESKTAYLMRLLDSRKNFLSKVADIQADPIGRSQTSHPAIVQSTGNMEHEETVSRCTKELAVSVDEQNLETSLSGGGSCGSLNEGMPLLGISDGSPKVSLAAEKQTIAEVDISSAKQSPKDGTVETSDDISGKETAAGTSVKKSSKAASSGSPNPLSQKTSPAQQVSPVDSICRIVSGWVSPETLSYLGLAHSNSQDNSTDQSQFHKDPEMQRKYQDLCQRLAGQEKDFDDILGEEEVEDKGNGEGKKKPMPHLEELRKQTEEFQEKVHHFLGGVVTETKKPSDKGDGAEATEKDRPVFLPVIDSHNQLLIRRRIVLERLDRSMPSLLSPLGLSVQDVSASLRELVFTFSLGSHNIVFKPVEWTLVALILLKMVEMKVETVRAALRSGASVKVFDLVLSRLGHSSASLGHLLDNTLSQCRQVLQKASGH